MSELLPYRCILEWITQKLNWQVNAYQSGTHNTDLKNVWQLVKIAVTGKSSLSKYISHGILGGSDLGWCYLNVPICDPEQNIVIYWSSLQRMQKLGQW